MYKIITFWFLFLCSVLSTAQAIENTECNETSETRLSFVVWTVDGGYVDYLLEENPVVVYENNSFVLTTCKVRVEYPVEDVCKFTLSDMSSSEDDQTDISVLHKDKDVHINSEMVAFSSLRPGGAIRIYNSSGYLLKSVLVSNDGKASVNLCELPVGIYIIKTDRITHKIIKK